MINDLLKTYTYDNGEIQRVQYVKLDDFSNLEIFDCKDDLNAFKQFANIYQKFLIVQAPFIFGRYIMFKVPRDLDLNPVEVNKLFNKDIRLTKDLKPIFKSAQAKVLYELLDNKECIALVKGKLPFTKAIRVSNNCGFISNHDKGVVKANASFFVMDPFDCATCYDEIGSVIGLQVKDGVVLSPPLFNREAFLLEDDKVVVRNFDISELKIVINKKKVKDYSIYVRPEYKKAKVSCGLVIVGNKVIDVCKGTVDVPSAGLVIDVKTGEYKVGDTVEYLGLENVKFGLQVGNSVIKDGVVTKEFISKFHDIKDVFTNCYPPNLYPHDFNKDRAARMILGESKDHKPVLVWFEGKGKLHYEIGKDSCGASLSEVGSICLDLGIINAINLDGGGSAQILINNKRKLLLPDRSELNDGQRAVPNGIAYIK